MTPIHGIMLSQTVRTLKLANKYGISFTQFSPFILFSLWNTHTRKACRVSNYKPSGVGVSAFDYHVSELGSGPGKFDSVLHIFGTNKVSINKLTWELNTSSALDRPPDWDICDIPLETQRDGNRFDHYNPWPLMDHKTIGLFFFS